MTTMSTAVGVSLLAHGLHTAMVLLGLWGLAALLLPHALTRFGAALGIGPDLHTRRVTALRAAVASGAPGIPVDRVPGRAASSCETPALSLPLALVASATAAGIHAAVAPSHLRDQVASGLVLLGAAVAQAGWAVAAQRPTRALLQAGILGNAALVVLWFLTRTVGLPGVLPASHPIGVWDLVCVAWQLIVIAVCVRTLTRTGTPGDPFPPCPGWFDWHPSTRAAVGVAAVSLVLLTLTGTHA